MRIEAITFEGAVGRMRKALYVYNMNLHKDRVKPETKERHVQNLIEAAKLVGSWGDPE